MSTSSRAIVHHLVARHAQIGGWVVHDTQTFEELGLEPLDLILIVVQLEALGELRDDVPLGALEHVRTVGGLVALVDAWRKSGVAAGHAPMPGVMDAFLRVG